MPTQSGLLVALVFPCDYQSKGRNLDAPTNLVKLNNLKG